MLVSGGSNQEVPVVQIRSMPGKKFVFQEKTNLFMGLLLLKDLGVGGYVPPGALIFNEESQ